MTDLTNLLKSESDTCLLGQKIASSLRGGEIILLFGDMGAGKTTLTKAIARELGVISEVSSPTFTLQNIYEGRIRVRHFDLFRLQTIEELEAAGLDEFFGEKDSVCIIEWPEIAMPLIDAKRAIRIDMHYVDENTRSASIIFGDKSKTL